MKKNIYKKIGCVLIIIVIVTIMFYLLINKKSRLRSLEKLNIVSVSENVTTPLRFKYDTINYFISKDKNVYILKNKELTELKKLFGAKKIITTYYNTIVLMEDGTLWYYDAENDILKSISEIDNCCDIINGDSFYAILKENGEVWLSKNIVCSEEREEYTKINLSMKIKNVVCNNYHRGNNENLSLCFVDENNEMWAYGLEFSLNNDYSFNENYLLKIEGINCIEKLTSKFESSLFMSNGKAYNFSVGTFNNNINDRYRINGLKFQYTKDDFLIDIDGNVTDILSGANNIGYIKTKEGKLYTIQNNSGGYKINEIDKVDFDFKMFYTSYGNIIINDNGEIWLYRDYSIFEEQYYDTIEIRSDEILPLWDLF